MSDGHQLELQSDGQGGVWLNYWDGIAGNDRLYHLEPPGNRNTYTYTCTKDVDGEDVRVYDLIRELITLAQELDKENS